MTDRPTPDPQPRIGGVHWWDPDRANHLADKPRFCPNCGGGVTGSKGISIEYWEADHRVFHTWCNACGWSGDVVRIQRMVGHEPED